MNSEIVALCCPSCGGADSIDVRGVPFGYHFKCKQCAATSALIINRELYVPRPGEHVCIACGRVAPASARFCQCGASLVRQCISCSHEFPADHGVCDQCGWPQGTLPNSPEGSAIRTQRLLADLNSVNRGKVRQAILDLPSVGPPALVVEAFVSMMKRDTERTNYEPMIYGLGYCGKAAVSPLSWLTQELRTEYIRLDMVHEAMARIGEASIPALIECVERATQRPLTLCEAICSLADRFPGKVLPALKLMLGSPGYSSGDIVYALRYCGSEGASLLVSLWPHTYLDSEIKNSLIRLGDKALPSLNKVSGMFAPNPVKTLARQTIACIEADRDRRRT